MAFELIKEDIVYKEVITPIEDGYWDSGVYYGGNTPEVTYTEVGGYYEPIGSGEKTQLLPSGLQSRKAIWLFTSEDLKVATNLSGSSFTTNDVIFLENPAVVTDTPRYHVFDEEDWVNGASGFELLDKHNTYICLREQLK